MLILPNPSGNTGQLSLVPYSSKLSLQFFKPLSLSGPFFDELGPGIQEPSIDPELPGIDDHPALFLRVVHIRSVDGALQQLDVPLSHGNFRGEHLELIPPKVEGFSRIEGGIEMGMMELCVLFRLFLPGSREGFPNGFIRHLPGYGRPI